MIRQTRISVVGYDGEEFSRHELFKRIDDTNDELIIEWYTSRGELVHNIESFLILEGIFKIDSVPVATSINNEYTKIINKLKIQYDNERLENDSVGRISESEDNDS